MTTIADSFYSELTNRSREASALTEVSVFSPSAHQFFDAKSKALVECTAISLQEIGSRFRTALAKYEAGVTEAERTRLYGIIDGYAVALGGAEGLLRGRADQEDGAESISATSLKHLKGNFGQACTNGLRDAYKMYGGFTKTDFIQKYFWGKAVGYREYAGCELACLEEICTGFWKDAYRNRTNEGRRNLALGTAAAIVELLAITRRGLAEQATASRNAD